MSMNDGPTGIAGMIVEEVGGIQVDHMIAVLLFQEDIGVGVGALEPENHIKMIPIPRNVIETVLLRVEGSRLVLIQDHLGTTGKVDHPQEKLKTEKNIGRGPGLDQLKLTITLVIGWMKVEKKSPNTRTRDHPDHPPLRIRLVN